MRKLGPRQRRRFSAASPLWTRGGSEPPLGEMLADPIVGAVMRRDRLTREDVETVLRTIRGRRCDAGIAQQLL